MTIYYRIHSDIRVKIYCHLILLRASVLNFEHLDILRDTIRHPSKKLLSFILLRASILNFERLDILRDSFGHPSKKLLSFYIAQNFCSEFRASRYTTGFNRTSELKIIAICICYELSFSTTSVSIYCGTQSDIRVKSYCRLNLLRSCILNFECLDILRNSIGHPSKKLLSFEFAQSFYFQFRAFRCIT